MHISIDTSEPLTETDKQILSVLSGGTNAKAATPAPAAKKTAAAPAKTETKVADPEPEAEEDPSTDEPAGHTKADLKALATKVVAAGDAKKVKAALESVGAGKISDVTDDQVDTVYAALSA